MSLKQLTKLPTLFLFFILTTQTLFSNNKFTKTQIPNWVQKISYTTNDSLEKSGGYHYLLIDLQDNLVEESYYRHYAIRVLNSDGIQSMSDIDISFDPSYQKLYLHELKIIRNGKVINKMLDSKIQTIQQESSADRLIYDGSLTTIINLKDIRENDIIEYSYSRKGTNPINKGSYSNTLYQQYESPVNRIYNRIVFSKSSTLNYKLFNGAVAPKIEKINTFKEFVWDVNALEFIVYDNQVPQWYDPQKRVALTTYNSWEEVVNWGLPLFIDQNINVKDILLSDYSDSKKENIRKLIEFVQDDVRYLGFESGINAYKPHHPKQVLNQRFGDCKDKSLLLISLLKQEGADAYPLLINTQLKDEITSKLPSHSIFDHCIVYFEFEDETYIIDPTNSNQGGNIDVISSPNYAYGLLIKPNQKELIEIPNSTKSSLDIIEKMTLDSIGGLATLNVISTYSGEKADNIRSYFNATKKESIKKEYLNFYSNLYTNIEAVGSPKIINDDREKSNDIIIEENYIIPNLWLDLEGGEIIYFETSPLVLESSLNFTNSATRNMPYFLGSRHYFSQTSIIKLPEEWALENYNIRISGDAFEYSNTITFENKTATIKHNYTLKKEYIQGDEVNEFIKKNDKVLNELPYNFTYNKDLAKNNFSWMATILFVILLFSGVYYSLKIYKNYNPIPLGINTNNSIGGWLVLPAIGLAITPVMLVFGIFDGDYFSRSMWINASSFENSHWVLLLIVFEFIFNTLFIVFSVLVAVLFFQRRTNAPKLIMIFYIISFVVPLFDTIMSYQLFSEDILGPISDAYKDIFKSLIGVFIWVPYFNVSKRVKNTFVKIYN